MVLNLFILLPHLICQVDFTPILLNFCYNSSVDPDTGSLHVGLPYDPVRDPDNNPGGGNTGGDNNPGGGNYPGGDNNPGGGNYPGGDNNPGGGNTNRNNPQGGNTGGNNPQPLSNPDLYELDIRVFTKLYNQVNIGHDWGYQSPE